MKVFLSWSGEPSHQLALALREWLPYVVHAIEPYVSSEDIDKGSRWSLDIAKELEASTLGILCITRDNLEAPWIHFEAGALSKALDKNRVVPFLVGPRPADLKGPLVQFQAVRATIDDVWKLVCTLTTLVSDGRLDEPRLRKTFEKWWPDLEVKLKEIAAQRSTDAPKSPDRPVYPIIQEVLETVRAQQKALVAIREELRVATEDRVRLEDAITNQSEEPSPSYSRLVVSKAKEGKGYALRISARNFRSEASLPHIRAVRRLLHILGLEAHLKDLESRVASGEVGLLLEHNAKSVTRLAGFVKSTFQHPDEKGTET